MSYDLGGLYIKFYECPKGKKLTEYFSELSPFPEFTECDDDRIKIAILSGDIDSPFVRIKERDTMMRAIFEQLSLDLNKNKKLFDDCAAYRDDKYMFAWVKYLSILHETDFTDWQLGKRHYAWQLERSISPQKEGETDKEYARRLTEAREEVKKLGKEIRSIEANLFPDSKAAREASIAESKKKIRLYAEKHAEPYDYF